MRKSLFILMSVMLAITASAQNSLSLQMFSAGVKTGVSVGDYRLTADCYDVYKHRMSGNGVAGAWFQYRTSFGLSVRPEIAYMGRGVTLDWADVHYRLRAHCLDLRVGVTYNFTIQKTLLSPYIVVAPTWNATLGGRVDYSDDWTGETVLPLSKSNMKMHDFDMFCGAGVEYPVFGKGWAIYLSGEVGYNWGLVRNFSRQETSSDINVLNASLDKQPPMGGRLGRGIEITVRVGVPFGQKIKRKIKTNDEEQWTEDSIDAPADTLEEESIEEVKPEEKPQEEAKPAKPEQKQETPQPSQPQLKEEDSEELEDLQQ